MYSRFTRTSSGGRVQNERRKDLAFPLGSPTFAKGKEGKVWGDGGVFENM